MAWTSNVTIDADKNNVGVAAAIWNAGLADEFTYTRRVSFTLAERNAFVAEAKAALTAYQTRSTQETTFEGQLNTALNG